MSDGSSAGGAFPTSSRPPLCPATAPAAPSAPPYLDEDVDETPPPLRWRLHLGLFIATALSVFLMGALQQSPTAPVEFTALVRWIAAKSPGELVSWFSSGWLFAAPLLAILVVHEFGHYIAARLHRVPATLPYFLPMPFLSLFGTMGAVIAMRGRIRSRQALLDIGASGPLAGLVVAIPVLLIGLSLSQVREAAVGGYIQEGQSLLYLLLKRLVLGPIPDGHDVHLHPTAFAGWAGLLVTMINLLPWGQLDGGHVAYALLGSLQHRLAVVFRMSLLLLFAYNASVFVLPSLFERSPMPIGIAISNSAFWLVWFVLLGVIARASGGGDHPPTDPGPLSSGRAVVGWFTLVMFILLFMPTPLSFHP